MDEPISQNKAEKEIDPYGQRHRDVLKDGPLPSPRPAALAALADTAPTDAAPGLTQNNAL